MIAATVQPLAALVALSASVQTLQGVGPRLTQRLERLGITTLQDLLFHLPARYQDRSRVTPIGSLHPAMEALVEADIVLAEVSARGRRTLICLLQDGTGSLQLRFFYFNARQQTLLNRGARVRCYGEVRQGATLLEMIHPEFHCLDAAQPRTVDNHLTPVYPTTEGLHQQTLRSLTEQALQQLETSDEATDGLTDYLPEFIQTQLSMPSLHDAIRVLHRPPAYLTPADLASEQHPARRRLAFEELLAHQLSLRKLRERTQRKQAPALRPNGELRRRFLSQLPFVLTAAQQRVIHEIETDLIQNRPMLRLVQGDVGSGKTIVAAIATLAAAEANRQVAVMAPTELLSEQHYRHFQTWLEPLGLSIVWLTSRIKGKARAKLLTQMREGQINIVIGTHALFQDQVEFSKLALVIIDEQHRFGVHQRLALREKGQQDGYCPHQLVMTATPIPRTLAMSVYADLDTSIVDELPPGRSPVKTAALPNTRRDQVIERIRLACANGRQVYWVCTLIEESEALQCQAAETTAELLGTALPTVRLGLLHGRLKPADKERIMAAFKNGALDLLIATTVIEVGVDVPNASLMIIENAERLGLAQLHQLRGRIGRGSTASSCVLMYQPPLSEQAHSRLAVLRDSNDGFVIAQRDLELRGPGDVLGTRQTGELELRIADLLRDSAMAPKIQQTADWLLRHRPDHADAIIKRWIGVSEHYSDV